jgi:SAM-dependent methyltransferase
MRSIGELFELLYLRYRVKWTEWKHDLHIRKMFPDFVKIDAALKKSSRPYAIPKAFPYGETPLLTLKTIIDRCRLGPDDTVVELGCGRGRSVFFLRHYAGCTVKGVEWVPEFVRRAQDVACRFQIDRVSFTCQDMLKTDVKEATFVYLYGTCLDDAAIEKIQALQFKPGAKIATVSYPLEGFKLLDQFTASFPWGEGEVFIQSN